MGVKNRRLEYTVSNCAIDSLLSIDISKCLYSFSLLRSLVQQISLRNYVKLDSLRLA